MPTPESKFSQISQEASDANHRSEMMRAMVEEFKNVEKYADLKKILQGKVAKDLFEDPKVSIDQILEVIDGIEKGSIEFYGSADPIYLHGKLIVLPGVIELVLNRCRRSKKYGPNKDFYDSLAREDKEIESSPISKLEKVETLPEAIRYLDYLIAKTKAGSKKYEKIINTRIAILKFDEIDIDQKFENSVLSGGEIRSFLERSLK